MTRQCVDKQKLKEFIEKEMSYNGEIIKESAKSKEIIDRCKGQNFMLNKIRVFVEEGYFD